MSMMVGDGITATAMLVLHNKRLLRDRNEAVLEQREVAYAFHGLKMNAPEACSLYAFHASDTEKLLFKTLNQGLKHAGAQLLFLLQQLHT